MSAWPLYRAMVGVGLVCGLLIVLVFQATAPVIARNRARALEKAILEVLPGSVESASFSLVSAESNAESKASGQDRFEPAGPESAGSEGISVHAGYDSAGKLIGMAVEASGMGYQDTIRVLYGYAPEADAIIGFQVLESRETPGLGDRIENDADFLSNFDRLDVSLGVSPGGNGRGLAQPIVAVAHGAKTDPWQIDGITGATISSVAVADMLRSSTEHWIPQLKSRAQDFTRNPASPREESP